MGDYIRSPLIRSLHAKLEHQQQHSSSTHPEWYSIRSQYVQTDILSRFLPFEQDEETTAFLSSCFEKSDWIFTHFYHAIAKAFLTWFISSTSINGLLRRGSMFVLSSRQFATLLDLSEDTKLDVLLDIGAGDGMVTSKMAPFFRQVHVTELSRPMQWRLAEHGFSVIEADSWYKQPVSSETESVRYDVVSCLNVLDRCETPLTILQNIGHVLKPNSGRLVLGIVLPLKQYVESTADHHATEILNVSDSPVWEIQLNSLVSAVLAPLQFELIRWTRVPYLCEGDFSQSFYYLNELVLVLRLCST
ncbi:hypothetical protein EG68_06030 [Paragonimus skrjabini miyazakii]|uniref:Methyltransferase-like protein 9 n=1 Tax=Paragonimus skrjabini miyazakii TaxID=59628 RepID=A0A8S9YNG8_9TREM|nr:hypothetical protein EG68_06030 [Paragonimus skrjabini miyazakii]